MISARNANQLKFQKRLIRAASQSPKVEAANLFAIVANNLDEFLTVRVPLDGDTDDALSEYVECMELLIQAVARKFPTFYSDHQIENISALRLISDEVAYWKTSSLIPDNRIADIPKIETDTTRLTAIEAIVVKRIIDELLLRGDAFPIMTQGGLFAHNHRFYHGYVWLLDLVREPHYSLAKQYLYLVARNLNEVITARLANRLPPLNMDLGKYMDAGMTIESLRVAHDAAVKWGALLEQLRANIDANGKNPELASAIVPEVREVRLETIAAPEHISTDQIEAYDHISRWVHAKRDPRNAPLVRVTFGWNPIELMLNMTLNGEETSFGGDPIRLAKRNFDVDGVAYDFQFEVDNPIAMNLPAVMHALVSQVNDYQGLTYLPDENSTQTLLADNTVRGYASSATSLDVNSKMLRGPMPDDQRSVINELLDRLVLPTPSLSTLFGDMVSDPDRNVCNESFTIGDIKELCKTKEAFQLVHENPANSSARWVSKAFLTIYRIDPLPDSPSDPMRGEALAFVLMMAELLKSNLHVFVECRARGDEINNLKLVDLLRYFGADVRMVPANKKFRADKVHAKVWTFHINNASYDRVTLYSTGNFSTEAMTNFSDTYVIEKKSAQSNLEVDNFFAAIFDGASPLPYEYRTKFFWAPKEIRKQILSQIHWVVQSHRAMVGDGYIFMKVNHLTDPEICRALMEAADAGVDVVVFARTTCTLPTYRVPGITVKSICGKVLEHDRAFIFTVYNRIGRQKDEARVFIGSADMMPRNLDHRIEFLYRLDDDMAKEVDVGTMDAICSLKTEPAVGVFVTKL